MNSKLTICTNYLRQTTICRIVFTMFFNHIKYCKKLIVMYYLNATNRDIVAFCRLSIATRQTESLEDSEVCRLSMSAMSCHLKGN
jgi:hypothetical protein